MSSPSDDAVVDATETAPKKGEEEQSNSFEARLIALAKESGQIQDDIKPSDSAEVEEIPKVEDQPEEETPEEVPEEPETEEQIASEKEEKEEAEDKPKGEPWPDSAKKRVAEEGEAKRRARERAERAEDELTKVQSRIAELESALANSSGPMPTPDNPLVDIQDNVSLDRLERVYEKLEEIDIPAKKEYEDDEPPISVPVDIGRDGKFIYRDVSLKEARLARTRADRVLRKDIPKRRDYLTQRAQIDANASELYPDLKDTNHEFTKIVNQLTNQVLNGQVLNSPEVKIWAAHAVYGAIKRSEELKSAQNGKNGDSPVKQIVEASKQKIAPTTPRTRTFVERKSGADLEKATKELEQNPDNEEAQLAYIRASRSNRGSQRKALQPTD